jgi:methylenetetrahydrofolate reductase (NADPH)
VAGPKQLDRVLGQLRDAGSNQVLLIAGDAETSAGPYASSMDVLESNLLKVHGFERVGIAGYPEGNRAIPGAALRRALLEKVRWASDAGVKMHIVSQFTFDARAVIEWEGTLMAEAIELPIHVGMVGQASVKQLLRYAQHCGVIASTRILVRGPGIMSAQVRTTIADELVLAFSNHRLLHQECAIVRAHFFAFGGAERTARWLGALRNGKFEIDANGKLVPRPRD